MLRKITVIHDRIIVQPYLGYGTPQKVSLCGRVLEDEGFPPAHAAAGRLHNVASFLKRLESDEVPGARVIATFGERTATVVTDAEGYFRIDFEAAGLDAGWHAIDLGLDGSDARATGAVLVPPQDAEFGIISDIDDTIVDTNVTRKLRMLVSLAFSNAHTRKPFPGVAAFYRALHRGRNPVFYVSKSPWNLYVPLIEFIQRQRLPPGPLLLRDFGLRMQTAHKRRAIEAILSTYPALPFILIGDSGEQDPEIYSDVVQGSPGRVRAIYIRSVHPQIERRNAIAKLARKLVPTRCQLVLAPDSAYAATHAAAEGLIPAEALRDIDADKALDA